MQPVEWTHDQCPECGGSVTVYTDAPQQVADDEKPMGFDPPYVCDGDRWVCEDGHRGNIICDAETPAHLSDPID